MGQYLRMTIEQAVAHQKRVKGVAPEAPLKRVHIPRAHAKVDFARDLAMQIRDAGLPEPVLEYSFDRQLAGTGKRDWRIDLAYPFLVCRKPLAIEVDGAVHRIKSRHKGDLPKHQALFEQGWDLLRVSPAQVVSGEALELVRRAIG